MKTYIILDEDLKISSEEFSMLWNSTEVTPEKRPSRIIYTTDTFDADLMKILSDVASIVTIASFVGIPSVYNIIKTLLIRKKKIDPKSNIEKEVEITIEKNDDKTFITIKIK
jgi:hypothetical protein